MDSHELTDIWRVMNPGRTRYTVHISGSSTKLTHADLMLVSPAMLTATTASDIEPCYSSDHNPISLSVVLGGRPRGKGYWKFPDFLLSDVQFQKLVQDWILLTVKENEETEPGLLWDTIKCNLRGLAIDYLAKAKKERKKVIDGIELDIFHASYMHDALAQFPDRVKIYSDRVDTLQCKLDDVYAKLNASTAIFKESKAYYESNCCTKFYFRNNVRKHDSIKCLYNQAGIPIYNEGRILQECRNYYQHLYSFTSLD